MWAIVFYGLETWTEWKRKRKLNFIMTPLLRRNIPQTVAKIKPSFPKMLCQVVCHSNKKISAYRDWAWTSLCVQIPPPHLQALHRFPDTSVSGQEWGTGPEKPWTFEAESTEDSKATQNPQLAAKQGDVSRNASGLPTFLPKWCHAAHCEG